MTDPYMRKQPRQSRSRALVESVLEAMDQLLMKGSEQLSLHEIARRAGVGIGSLYDYFSDADGLWGSLVRRLTQANFDALQLRLASTRDRPLSETVGDMVDATLATYLDNPARTRAVIVAIVRLGLGKYIVAERDRFAAVLAGRVLAEWPKADPVRIIEQMRLVCDLMMGVVTGDLWREADPAERERVHASLRLLIIRQVMAMGEAPPRPS